MIVTGISEAASLAVHACAYIASQGKSEPVSAIRMAEDMRVSPSHLAKVLQRLVPHGIVISKRGANGGFTLTSGWQNIPLYEIIKAVDGRIEGSGCLLGSPFCGKDTCIFRELSNMMAEEMVKELTAATLKKFVKTQMESIMKKREDV